MIKINANPKYWNKKCYICSLLNPNTIEYDEEGNEILKYDIPSEYDFNYQPISSDVDLMEFGNKASITQKAVIPIKYKNYFKENDLAYLDGKMPNPYEQFGEGANYRLLPPRNGNQVIIIYFEKITGK